MTEPVALLTGACGFLGAHVSRILADQGRRVVSMDLPDGVRAAEVRCDLATRVPVLDGLDVNQVYHLAGLAHVVPRSEPMRRRFYDVNLDGTRNLLAGLDRQRALECFVFVSTVAVYGVQSGELLDESAPRQAEDPYGKSKRLAEDLVVEWCEARRIPWGIVRLPLVVGRGAPGNFGAMVRAIRGGWYLGIGDGSARRSMVTAEDAARGIWSVGEVGGVYHLTDGENPTLRELEVRLGQALGRRWIPRIPVALARILAIAGDTAAGVSGREMPFDSLRYRRMTATLTFSDQKARRELGWKPKSVLAALDADRGLVA